jgi:hypothetical protein
MAFSQPFNGNRFIEAISKIRPAIVEKLPHLVADPPRDLSTVDCAKAEEILRKAKGSEEAFQSFQSCISDILDTFKLQSWN